MRVPELSYIAPRNVGAMKLDAKQGAALASNPEALRKLGIAFDSRDLAKMNEILGAGMDADLVGPNVTVPSATTPVQFLQSWLPGFVEDITSARKIDMLVGVATQGNWADEEIVQGIMERSGDAVPYGDYTNVPLSSWNVNFERRTIVRFEEGLQVGRLEEDRAAAMRVSSADSKRFAASRALEIQRNRVGFFGYNDGANRTYGFLNDPDLPAYVTVAPGVGGSTWASKTYLEIVADLRTGFAQLRTQSEENVDPTMDEITIAVATDAVDYLSTVSDFGNSVLDWLRQSYPKARVMSAPELNDAGGGGVGVFYMYAETVSESGSDDNRTWIQVVPQKFMSIGVEQRAKNYVEDYSNATAGVMCKRPYAVVRYEGIS